MCKTRNQVHSVGGRLCLPLYVFQLAVIAFPVCWSPGVYLFCWCGCMWLNNGSVGAIFCCLAAEDKETILGDGHTCCTALVGAAVCVHSPERGLRARGA